MARVTHQTIGNIALAICINSQPLINPLQRNNRTPPLLLELNKRQIVVRQLISAACIEREAPIAGWF
jgi:hypothetical protein